MTKGIVPSQEIGSQTGVSKVVELVDRQEAIELFNRAKVKMLDVNHWHEMSGAGSAVFAITDTEGNVLDKQAPEMGDLIRIDLPGPSNPAGNSYDWVRVEAIEDEEDADKDQVIFAFRVRPMPNPMEPKDESAHFYTFEATSTFLLTRFQNKVAATQKGRNEVVNTDTDSFMANARNAIVVFSAIFGFSIFQWKKFVDGLLEGSDEQDATVSVE